MISTLNAVSRNRSERKLFLIPFVGVLFFTLIASVVLEWVLRTWYLEKTNGDLHQVIKTTMNSVERLGANADDMQIIVESVALVMPNYRITVTDLDGKIVGDSMLEDLAQNSLTINDDTAEEIAKAKIAGEASVIRHSILMDSEVLFIAQRVRSGNFNGIIRVGMRTKEYSSAVKELRYLLMGLAFVALIFMAILVTMFVRYLNSSLKEEQLLLESRVEERTQDILLLHRLTNMLAACQSLEEVQGVVEDIVPRIIGTINCSVSLVNASRNLVEKKIDWSGDWPGEEVFSPHDCWALRKGKHHFSHDEYSSQACHHMADCKDNTLCIPLLAHGNAIGLLHMIVGKEFDPADNDLAFTIAEHLGLALANLDMQERLRQQATRDPLTGLYNRRHFEESLEKEFSRSQRHNESCALLMLDIDHFKRFNDNFGHDAGDYVLKTVGQLLKDSIRTEDIACRLGGEEIAIVLPKTNASEALRCAEKIRQLIADKHYQLNNITLGTVTVSTGLAIYPQHGTQAEAIVKAADIALYQAKENGRNRVEAFEDAKDGKNISLVKQDSA